MSTVALSPPNARRLSGGGRRLSGGPNGRRLSGWRPEDVENLLEENDDDKEREAVAEQRKAEMAKEKMRSPLRETPGHQRRQQVYKDCIQMAAEDRVNAQNAFYLDLIDHMGQHVAQGADASGQPNFQMASTTLDAGIKIYSYRVDSVFTQTFKCAPQLPEKPCVAFARLWRAATRAQARGRDQSHRPQGGPRG
jgi:hypothetical protein